MKNPSIVTILLVAGLGLAATIPAQRTWVVAGSGGDFTQVDPAIRAASAGDRIEVRTGTYLGFTLNKRLTIVGAPAKISSTTGILRGAEGSHVSGLELMNFNVKGVRGPLLLRDLTTQVVSPQPKVLFEDSGPVHAARLRVYAALLAGKPDLLTINRATVYLHNSVIWGYGYDANGHGHRAMLVTDSVVVAATTRISGAPGRNAAGMSCLSTPRAGDGGPGVRLTRSKMALIAGSNVVGGSGGRSIAGYKCGADGVGVVGDRADVSSDSVATGATNALGVVPRLDLVPTLGIGTTGNAQFTFAGGRTIASYFSAGHAQILLPGLDLPVLLGGTINFFDARAVVSGRATVPIPIPNKPAFRNLVLHFQSVGFDSAGRGQLSNSSALLIR